jgi:excisionase family DNA binding protein
MGRLVGEEQQVADRCGMTSETETRVGPVPALLTLMDVAAILRVSRRQVHRLLAAGRLPAADVNLGVGARGRRWIRERLLAWVAAGCPPADAWRAWQGRDCV